MGVNDVWRMGKLCMQWSVNTGVFRGVSRYVNGGVFRGIDVCTEVCTEVCTATGSTRDDLNTSVTKLWTWRKYSNFIMFLVDWNNSYSFPWLIFLQCLVQLHWLHTYRRCQAALLWTRSDCAAHVHIIILCNKNFALLCTKIPEVFHNLLNKIKRTLLINYLIAKKYNSWLKNSLKSGFQNIVIV